MKVYQKGEVGLISLKVRDYASQIYVDAVDVTYTIFDALGAEVDDGVFTYYTENEIYLGSFPTTTMDGKYDVVMNVGDAANLTIVRDSFKVVEIV